MTLLLSKTGGWARWSLTPATFTRREMGLWARMVGNIEKQKKIMRQEKIEESRTNEINMWREYQLEQSKFQERKKASQEFARWQEQEEQRLRQEAQEALVRAELEKKLKSSGTPEDKLDENYFKDYSRFNIRQDQRDPLIQNIKNNPGGSEDIRTMFREGIRDSKETFQQIKDSKPFTYTGVATQGGRFGFQTVEVGTWIVVSILALFAGLAFFELKAVYEENLIEKQALNANKKYTN